MQHTAIWRYRNVPGCGRHSEFLPRTEWHTYPTREAAEACLAHVARFDPEHTEIKEGAWKPAAAPGELA